MLLTHFFNFKYVKVSVDCEISKKYIIPEFEILLLLIFNFYKLHPSYKNNSSDNLIIPSSPIMFFPMFKFLI